MKVGRVEYFGSMVTSVNGVQNTQSVVARVNEVLTFSSNIGNRKIPTPYSYSLWRASGNWIKTERKVVSGAWTTTVTSSPNATRTAYPTTVDWAELEGLAMNEVYDKLKGGLNLANDVVDFGSTRKMLKNIALLGRSVKRLRRDVLKAHRSGQPLHEVASKILADQWLRIRYGIMPLVYSTYDALDNMLRRVQSQMWFVGKARKGLTTNSGRTGFGTTASPYVTSKVTLDSARVRLLVNMDVEDGFRWSDWTSLNPALIAWEALPLSFVLDWFVNIGDTLSSWENFMIFAKDFNAGWVTRSYAKDVQSFSYGSASAETVYWPGTGIPMSGSSSSYRGSDSCQFRSLSRRQIYSIPMPPKIQVRAQLNAKRVLDAVSLVRNMR